MKQGHGCLAVDGRGIEELGEDVQIRCLQRARPRFIAGPVALVNRRPPAFQYQYTYVTDTYEYLGECEYAPLNVKGAAGLTT